MFRRKRHRGLQPKDGTNLVCRVCGDRALGYNYDAITCQACKAFFRRNVLKPTQSRCINNGNCKLDWYVRRCCSWCRLKQCFFIGMKKELITGTQHQPKSKQESPKLSPSSQGILSSDKAVQAVTIAVNDSVHQECHMPHSSHPSHGNCFQSSDKGSQSQPNYTSSVRSLLPTSTFFSPDTFQNGGSSSNHTHPQGQLNNPSLSCPLTTKLRNYQYNYQYNQQHQSLIRMPISAWQPYSFHGYFSPLSLDNDLNSITCPQSSQQFSHLSSFSLPKPLIFNVPKLFFPLTSSLVKIQESTIRHHFNYNINKLNDQNHLQNDSQHKQKQQQPLSYSPSSSSGTCHTNNMAISLPDPYAPVPLTLYMFDCLDKLSKEYTVIFDGLYKPDQVRKEANTNNIEQLQNIMIIFIRRLIKFAMHVPEFKSFSQHDQIHLLKGGIMEMYVLKSVMSCEYKPGAEKNKMAPKDSSDSDMMLKIFSQKVHKHHKSLTIKLHELTSKDKIELALLFTIELLTPDRVNLMNRQAVLQGKERHLEWLKIYLESLHSRSRANELFFQLLETLAEVRKVGGATSCQQIIQMAISKVEPLLLGVM